MGRRKRKAKCRVTPVWLLLEQAVLGTDQSPAHPTGIPKRGQENWLEKVAPLAYGSSWLLVPKVGGGIEKTGARVHLNTTLKILVSDLPPTRCSSDGEMVPWPPGVGMRLTLPARYRFLWGLLRSPGFTFTASRRVFNLPCQFSLGPEMTQLFYLCTTGLTRFTSDSRKCHSISLDLSFPIC